MAATGLAVAATPANAACTTVNLWSTDTNLLITAEKDYTNSFAGTLRARTPWAQRGTWELFDMCYVSGLTFTLRAHANGLYVAREGDYGGNFKNLLRARTPGNALGTWEQFTLTESGGDVSGILGSNGLYVAYEGGGNYTGMFKNVLRARTAGERGPWESWTFQAT